MISLRPLDHKKVPAFGKFALSRYLMKKCLVTFHLFLGVRSMPGACTFCLVAQVNAAHGEVATGSVFLVFAQGYRS